MAKKRRTNRRRSKADNLTLADSAGRPRIMLGFLGEGDQEVATFHMFDASCRPRVLMNVEPQGRSVISLLASNGSGSVGLATNENDEISLGISRPPGIPILSVRWNATDGL